MERKAEQVRGKMTSLCPTCRHWSNGECLSLDRRLNRFYAAAGLANVQAMGCAFWRRAEKGKAGCKTRDGR